MMNPTSLCLLFILVLVSLHPNLVLTQEVEDEGGFDYLEDSGRGPENWGDLKPEWAKCKEGKMQSPIDLRIENLEVHPDKGEVKFMYKPGNATVINRGHVIEVRWELGDAGFVKINGSKYLLHNCHWHTPSEHTIQGNRFNMELHMVHINQCACAPENITVVAYLYTLGKPDEFLAKITPYIETMSVEHEEEHYGLIIDPRVIQNGGKKYFKYMGSLTTPPCTEGVTWLVNKKISTVSQEQLAILREAVDDSAESNARPLQDLNNRKIQYFHEKTHSYSMAPSVCPCPN